MIDIHLVRKDFSGLRAQLVGRYKDPHVLDQQLEHVLACDTKKRTLQYEHDQAAATLSNISEALRTAAQTPGSDPVQLRQLATQHKGDVQALSRALKKAQQDLEEALSALPNIPHPQVPLGKSAEDNVIHTACPVRVGPSSKPHWDIIQELNIIDLGLGNTLTGAGFPVYLGQGARLQRALINFFLDQALQKGYTEVQPPVLVKEESAYATGQLPDKEAMMYFTQDNFYLIPTAEVPLTNLYRKRTLLPEQLPIKLVGYTPCFRREAGSWGSHVRGLNRLHQFDKVELVEIHPAQNSLQALENLRKYVTSLAEKLELPYRVLQLCTADLGHSASITYDLELWSCGQGRWLEASSISLFSTYQSMRLGLRHKDAGGKLQYAHTLNASALALPRLMAALLEQGYQDGCVHLPQVLHSYTGFSTITPQSFC